MISLGSFEKGFEKDQICDTFAFIKKSLLVLTFGDLWRKQGKCNMRFA